VDAEEGVMPQTKFVLTKALKMGLRPILCINKVDRAHADPDRVHNETFDLFAAIGATDEQLDFPHIYASGRSGWATLDLNVPNDNLHPLFDLIVDHVPAPKVQENKDKPFQMLNVLIESDPFLGRLLTGRIQSGKAVPGMAIHALDRDGKNRARPHHQGSGLPRPEASGPGRRFGSRRHRRHRRHVQGHRGRHPVRHGSRRRPAGPTD
jgi:GTP-binding protein